MKNIEIKIFKETRMVELNKFIIGNDGENLQGNLVFTFDEFVDGQARLEYVIDGNKNYIVLEKVDETYQVPILSVITKKGQIDMQVVVTQGTEDVAIFKSNLFYLTCNASINAEIEQPDEYLQWIEVANAKLNEVDNLDIDAVKENGVATITITKKDGTQQSVNLFDAEGAVTNYELLENLPSINGVELTGDKSLDELNIQEKGDYLTSETDPVFKQSASYGITSQDINNWNNKSEFSGNYDDLNGKPTIPTKTSELTNDSGFVSEIPSEYVTEEELNNKKYLTSIPSEYVTESELNEKGYLTEHQSLDHLQEKLKSGENIKTINGNSILGSGNITIEGGTGGITEIPIASTEVLGGIKVGANLSITDDGTLNASVVEKSYIQAALNSNVVLVDANTADKPSYLNFDKITKSGTMFEVIEEGRIKINSNGKSGRLKLHMHAAFLASDTPVNSAFISIRQLSVGNAYDTEIGQINMGLFGAESRNSSAFEVIVDYKDGDTIFVFGGAYGTSVTLLASLNRTLLILEEI